MIDPLFALLIAGLAISIASVIFWPQRGLVARWQEARRMTVRVLSEDALKHIHRCEREGRPPSLEGIAGRLGISPNQAASLIAGLETKDLVWIKDGEISLTPTGRDYALRIIRAHRLWESYLAEETGYQEVEWHSLAERIEHTLTQAEADALSAQLGNPTHDPHGDPIPTRQGEFIPHGGIRLPKITLDQPARIVHIEDEPHIIYEQITAEGLYPGQEVRVMEITPQRVRFWSNGDEHVLAPLLANNIGVVPLMKTAPPPSPGVPLDALEPGQHGKVIHISRAIRGAERRRLMDLGLLPGTEIGVEFRSPGGDPTAYRMRGALIALREDQARHIRVQPINHNNPKKNSIIV